MAPEALMAMSSCLSFADDSAAVNRKVGAIGWERVLAVAQELRMAPAVVARLVDKHAVPDIPAIVLPSGVSTVTAQLQLIWREHIERRRQLYANLVELVGAMNRNGLEPVLLKGARSLATGQPAWRSMRDLDLLLFGPDAKRAHEVALALGYRPDPASTEKAGKHHYQPLFRDDLPGWIEIHQKAATHRAEGLLPTQMLKAMTAGVAIGDASARILTLPAHTLHAVIHHHVGHRGDKNGGIDLKGLFEFSADLMTATSAERHELLALAGGHPRLLSTLDFWVAAAHTIFGMPSDAPFDLHRDALDRAAVALNPDQPRGRYSGVIEELAFAAGRERLQRLPCAAAEGRELDAAPDDPPGWRFSARPVNDLEVWKSPWLHAHVERHDGKSLGFDLAAAPYRVLRTCVGTLVAIAKRRKDQTVAVQVGPHQQHRTAHRLQSHRSLPAPMVEGDFSLVGPGIQVKALAAGLDHAVGRDDVEAGRDELVQDIGRIVRQIDIHPQNIVFVAQGAEQQLVAGAGEDLPPRQLQPRRPARLSWRHMEAVILLVQRHACRTLLQPWQQVLQRLEASIGAVAFQHPH
jgi:hypothetical protein